MNRKRLGLVLAGLGLLFASCEKDVLENRGQGEKVEIFFSMNTMGYNTGGNVVRGAAMLEQASTTMYLNDSIYLRTTLAPDSELRATAPFINGQRICFEAFDISDPVNPVDSKIYTYSESTGKFTPLTTPLGVEPDGSTIYRFVAYSYFGEANTTPSATIDLSKDLVWGKSGTDRTVVDTETSRTVDINMNHLFAQVKVRVVNSISGNITILNGVEIEGGTQATLVPFDGSFTPSSPVVQGVSFTGLPAAAVESGQRLVFPVTTAPTKVKIGNVRVSVTNTTFSNNTVEFYSTLDAGVSYTLVVELKRCVWARSNIYWDGSKLTFVRAGADISKEGYQGVFFKWGSLIGVSPVGTYYPSSVVVYKPTAIATGTYSAWNDIPFWNANVYGEVLNNSMANEFKGEICSYIDGNYRMPAAGEFGTTNVTWENSQEGWETHGNYSAATGTADGTYDLIDNGYAYAKNIYTGIRCPASGRRGSTGNLITAGNQGFYLTASTVGTTGSAPYMMHFYSGWIYPMENIDRHHALPIRCVQN